MASLERQRPDVVISAGSFDDEVVLARALLESGLPVKAVGLAAAAMQEFLQTLGTDAEGFLGPSQWEPRLAYVPDFGPGPDEVTEGIRAQGAPPDYPAAQAYAACLIAQRCLEEAGDDESLWRAACALDCGTFFGRFRIDPATGPAGRPRDGPRAVAAREEARGLAAPRVRGQAPVPGAAMDWCQWECELTED